MDSLQNTYYSYLFQIPIIPIIPIPYLFQI